MSAKKKVSERQDTLDRSFYYGDYLNQIGFMSYYYQIKLIIDFKPTKILEIGCGNKIVTNYIKQSGYSIDTCDFNENLEPDYIADIRKLPFDNESYDLVTAYEVLEHIPWEDIDKGLSELKRVSQRYVIISLPYPSFFKIEVVLCNTTLSRIFGKTFFSLLMRIPPFFKKHSYNGLHHWEIGKKGHSLRIIEKKLKEHFRIIKKVRPTLNPYHQFFVLEKE